MIRISLQKALQFAFKFCSMGYGLQCQIMYLLISTHSDVNSKKDNLIRAFLILKKKIKI